MSRIKIEHLTRDYGGGRGVFDLSFEVGEGEAFGFLGPNGAGKTTTIRHLMGFLRPVEGRCTIDGMDCRKDAAAIQSRLGYIPGEINFFDDMSGAGFLKFCARYRGMSGGGRTEELLKRFELDPRGKIKKMSKGMKQKIGIVAAFMHDPDILILDEPTSGLDPLMQSRFIGLVAEEKERGKTILMSSHMFDEVERTCHRVGIIRAGRLVAVDSVDALKAARLARFIVSFEDEAAVTSFLAEPLQSEAIGDLRVLVVVKNNIQDVIATLGRYPVAHLSAPEQTLEEIFMHYYGGDDNV